MKFTSILIIAYQYIACWLNPYSANDLLWNSTSQQIAISRRQVLTKTKFGFSMIVDSKDDTVSRQIRERGTWQTHIIRLIKKIVIRGNYILNIGSQTGMEAIYMAKIVGQSGKVYVFQPYSNSYRIMRKNVYLNNLENRFVTYNIGASNAQQFGRMTISYSNTGGSQVYDRKDLDEDSKKQFQKNDHKPQNGWGQYQYITLNKLDNVIPSSVKFDFALIDVQTMQIQVLDGMREVIKRSPNLVLLVQWTYKQKYDQMLGTSVILFLWEQGYTFYQLTGSIQCFSPILQKKNSYQELRSIYRADFLLIPNGMQLDL